MLLTLIVIYVSIHQMTITQLHRLLYQKLEMKTTHIHQH